MGNSALPTFRSALILGLGALLLGTAQASHARVEALRWEHPNPSAVTGFLVYWGTASGSYNVPIDVGKPTPDQNGHFRFDLSLDDAVTAYIAVSAYNQEEESPLSREIVRQGQSTPPPGGEEPSPTEPPPGGGGSDPFSVSVQVTSGLAFVTSTLSGGVGPFQFLFDCGNDGTWNGVVDTTKATAEHTCQLPSSGIYPIRAFVWDQGGAVHEKFVSVDVGSGGSPSTDTPLGTPGRPQIVQ